MIICFWSQKMAWLFVFYCNLKKWIFISCLMKFYWNNQFVYKIDLVQKLATCLLFIRHPIYHPRTHPFNGSRISGGVRNKFKWSLGFLKRGLLVFVLEKKSIVSNHRRLLRFNPSLLVYNQLTERELNSFRGFYVIHFD